MLNERRLPYLISGTIVAALAIAGARAVVQEDNIVRTVPTQEPVRGIARTIDMPVLPADQTVVIEATGDMNLGRFVNIKSRRFGDYFWPFMLIENKLPNADILIGNLESPAVKDCPQTEKGLTLCFPIEAVPALSKFGFDVVNIANNHIFDYKIEGRGETIEALGKNNIAVSDEEHLAVVERKGIRFGFIGFNRINQGLGFTPITEEEIVLRIKESVGKVDVLIVSFHWGKEYEAVQDEEQTRLGRLAIDLGAKVVLGTHPHVPQQIEEYNGGLIIYSSGNFVFDQKEPSAATKGFAALINFSGNKLASYETVPITIENWGQPRIVTSD